MRALLLLACLACAHARAEEPVLRFQVSEGPERSFSLSELKGRLKTRRDRS